MLSPWGGGAPGTEWGLCSAPESPGRPPTGAPVPAAPRGAVRASSSTCEVGTPLSFQGHCRAPGWVLSKVAGSDSGARAAGPASGTEVRHRAGGTRSPPRSTGRLQRHRRAAGLRPGGTHSVTRCTLVQSSAVAMSRVVPASCEPQGAPSALRGPGAEAQPAPALLVPHLENSFAKSTPQHRRRLAAPAGTSARLPVPGCVWGPSAPHWGFPTPLAPPSPRSASVSPGTEGRLCPLPPGLRPTTPLALLALGRVPLVSRRGPASPGGRTAQATPRGQRVPRVTLP